MVAVTWKRRERKAEEGELKDVEEEERAREEVGGEEKDCTKPEKV